MPRLKRGIPFLGHALEFRRNPVNFLQRGYDEFGEIFAFKLGGKRMTVLIGPSAHEAFFSAPDDQFSRRHAYKFMVPLFGKGLVEEQIAFFFPALREQRLQSYARLMELEVENYVSRWPDEGEIDVLNVTRELILFIVTGCLIGQKFRQGVLVEFTKLYNDIKGCLNLAGILMPNAPLPANLRRDRARARMVELISQTVAERLRNGISEEDFLQTLMEARWKDGTAMGADVIAGMLLAVTFAGAEISTIVAAWTGILLLQHPLYLEQVVQEQHEVVGSDGMTLEALRRMHALERCLKEAERLRSPMVMVKRAVLRDFEYAGYRIPAGEQVMISPAVSGRLSTVFSNPDRYDPDRFAPGRNEEGDSPYRLVSFGGGRHRCIGQRFAYQQIKAIWSVLLRRFDLEAAQSEYPLNYAPLITGPRQPALIRYRRKRG